MKNVLEYLEQASANHPEKLAVAYGDERYSYRELRDLSRKIGARIRQQGVVNQPIGVIADRSITTLAFFFGVLYSGNFYVPIDPELAKAKLEAMIEDSQFPIILEKDKEISVLDEVCFSGERMALSNCEQADDSGVKIPSVGGRDPVYMVYTSGSTGKPKGVLKSHGAVISYIEAYTATFDFSENEIIGNQTPFFFDASAKDIYLMLKLGCSMEILPTSLFSLPPELMDYLNTKKVTFVSWVPTALSLVAQLSPFSLVKPETVKKVFFVGEVMPMKHLNTWRKNLPDIQYVNLYGSSEIAGICCYYEVQRVFQNDQVLPMGKPLDNCKIYLLDKDEIIREPNRVGEMYLVSDALATEYFNDPEKTERSFLMKDFGEGLVRCFKTGDLASYDSDGNLIFAARTDFQIKHMGHRIELGEIESVAGALPEINRCCCLYNAPKRKIILFCELADGAEKTGQEIRSILREQLSSYMLPGKVHIMEHLPISPNGKIDRQALKALL